MNSKSEERESITLVNRGQKIFGILHRPQTKEKVPAILICSGYGGNKAGKHRLFVRLAQELAKQGCAVFRFDYRGAGDSEGEFQEITLEGKISDTMTCLKFLDQDPQIDPNRLGLLGRSLGGVIAVLAAKQYQNIKSLALWAPVFNSTPWKAQWNLMQAKPFPQEIKVIPFSTGIPNQTFLQEFFHLDLLEDLKHLRHLPILHIEGAKDTIVSEEHGQGYRLARQGINHTRFVRLANTDHDFSDLSDQNIAIAETCHWFQMTL